MIKINRTEAPTNLTAKLAREKTAEFQITKQSVWNYPWLKNALMEMSHGKCAYCECDLTSESNYMEVEHYRDKKDFPDKVLEWENLLPSCKRCNGTKGAHNVETEPIVNPAIDTPSTHLMLVGYRMKGKDDLGKATVECLKLNSDKRKMEEKRFSIGEKIDDCLNDIQSFLSSNVPHAIDKFQKLLKQCEEDKPYAAVSATIMHRSSVFNNIVCDIKRKNLWSNNLEYLYTKTKKICLF